MERLPTFQMMLGHLNRMTSQTEDALKDNTNWWVFGPTVCRKFINHAKSLELIFFHAIDEYNNDQKNTSLDISSIWTLVRALHETHAVFCHLFQPCANIEENILRFRLWELDSLRSMLRFKRDLVEEEISDTIRQLLQNETICQESIKNLPLFNQLPERSRETLL